MSAAGLDTQPSAKTYDLEDLISEAWSGGIRVPHFQRDFRWGQQDVIRLFDSIVKGYPVGSLLLWVRRSPAQKIILGALEIDAPSTDAALWVVDGQQRITSLANALHVEGNGYAPFNIFYDLLEKEFVPPPSVSDPRYIPVPVLFDLDKLLDWFAGPGQGVGDYFPEARRIAKLLRQFKVPAYLVKQDDEAVLTDIFDRMNNYGKRLSRAEIFSSLFAGPEAGAKDRLSIGRIAERIAARTGFGTVDDDTVLAAILARRGSDPMREIRIEFDDSRRRSSAEFPGESRDTAYAEGETALVRAIAFLQDSAGVPHLSLLAYRSLLVVLTRFFAHFPDPRDRSLQLLRRVYWRVAVSGPAVFKGSFTQLSRALCARVHPGDERASVQGLIDSIREAAPGMPNPDRFKTNEAGAKIILCSWWDLQPRSPYTGLPYDRQELTDLLADQSTAAAAVRRIFPRGLPLKQQLWSANRIFVPTATDPVDEIINQLSRQPLGLDVDTWEEVLRSYCMSGAAIAALNAGDRDDFLRLRQELVTYRLRAFLQRMAEWDFEDTPALDLLDFEDDDELEGRSDEFV
ncbi:DUF262 domain-containing protein [Micromonospora robiginosa]|uniref:DUF262 domain-containing protein n=1 Tax=Micromonospora robiginosa TaxID=2749844 RepID=A0A7L6B6B2_9ACTN|nr:DUF262 domain-containing protein [Micromonospora ferruginea]QLQ37493.1 DUF262 domain-containing protein [Micromonospora ferruginea]